MLSSTSNPHKPNRFVLDEVPARTTACETMAVHAGPIRVGFVHGELCIVDSPWHRQTLKKVARHTLPREAIRSPRAEAGDLRAIFLELRSSEVDCCWSEIDGDTHAGRQKTIFANNQTTRCGGIGRRRSFVARQRRMWCMRRVRFTQSGRQRAEQHAGAACRGGNLRCEPVHLLRLRQGKHPAFRRPTCCRPRLWRRTRMRRWSWMRWPRLRPRVCRTRMRAWLWRWRLSRLRPWLWWLRRLRWLLLVDRRRQGLLEAR
jgi:hypothetical protein